MLDRVVAIALNTYRESLRARILLGLAGVAFAVALYSLIVGSFTLHNAPRVVSDLGSASISIFGIAGGHRHRLHVAPPRARAEDALPHPGAPHPARRVPGRQVPRHAAHHRGLRHGRRRAGAAPQRGARRAARLAAVHRAPGVALALGARRRHVALALGAHLRADPLGRAGARGAARLLAGVVPDERRVVLGGGCAGAPGGGHRRRRSACSSRRSPRPSSRRSSPWASSSSAATPTSWRTLPPELLRPRPSTPRASFLSRVVPNLHVYVPPRPLLSGEAVGRAARLVPGDGGARLRGLGRRAPRGVELRLPQARLPVTATSGERVSSRSRGRLRLLGDRRGRARASARPRRAWCCSGEKEIALSTAALRAGDAHAAVEHARRAAGWYMPGAPHVRVAYERLLALGTAAEGLGDRDTALFAFRGVRTAASRRAGSSPRTRTISTAPTAPSPALSAEAPRAPGPAHRAPRHDRARAARGAHPRRGAARPAGWWRSSPARSPGQRALPPWRCGPSAPPAPSPCAAPCRASLAAGAGIALWLLAIWRA